MIRWWLRCAALVVAAFLGTVALAEKIVVYGPGPAGGGGTCCTLVSKAQNDNSTGSQVTTLATSSTLNVASGNLLVCGTRQGTDTTNPTSITDTAGNTFTRITGSNSASGANLTTLWYAKNATANASDTITANWGGAGEAYASIHCIQYSGASTSAPLDQSTNGTGSTTCQVNSAAFTTTVANEAIVATFLTGSLSNTFSNSCQSSIYTIELTGPSGMSGMMDQIVTSIQTGVTAGVNAAGGSAITMAVASFK
jgi:hypothetical protein